MIERDQRARVAGQEGRPSKELKKVAIGNYLSPRPKTVSLTDLEEEKQFLEQSADLFGFSDITTTDEEFP